MTIAVPRASESKDKKDEGNKDRAMYMGKTEDTTVTQKLFDMAGIVRAPKFVNGMGIEKANKGDLVVWHDRDQWSTLGDVRILVLDDHKKGYNTYLMLDLQTREKMWVSPQEAEKRMITDEPFVKLQNYGVPELVKRSEVENGTSVKGRYTIAGVHGEYTFVQIVDSNLPIRRESTSSSFSGERIAEIPLVLVRPVTGPFAGKESAIPVISIPVEPSYRMLEPEPPGG